MQIDPVPLHETWAAMEELKQSGLVKHIGVCNYSSALLHDLMAYAKLQPEVLQIESHPFLTQERLIRLAKSYGMTVTAFSLWAPCPTYHWIWRQRANPCWSLLQSGER